MKGSGDHADRHAQEAAELIRAVANDLTPEHAAGYLAAAPVAEALELAR